MAKLNIKKIDHLVVHIDAKYQVEQSYIDKIVNSGFLYQPKKGKETKGFKVSNLFVGNDYFEFVSLKTKKGDGWIDEWINHYNEGERGLICLMLDTDDINSVYNNLKGYGMSTPEILQFKLFKFIPFKMPWKNAYLPFFEGVPFQIGFQQMDDEKSQVNMRKRMLPNSRDNGIEQITKLEIYGNFTQNDFTLLKNIFKEQFNNNTLELPNQIISFIHADFYKVKVVTKCKNEQFLDSSFEIENIIVENK